jgi:hypothetical protein
MTGRLGEPLVGSDADGVLAAQRAQGCGCVHDVLTRPAAPADRLGSCPHSTRAPGHAPSVPGGTDSCGHVAAPSGAALHRGRPDGIVHFELTANTAVAVHTRNAGQAIPVHRIVCCDFFDFLSTW